MGQKQDQSKRLLRLLDREKTKIIVVLFFLVYLGIGIVIYPDYGLSWDEKDSRDQGTLALRYIFNGDPAYLESRDRNHGPAFEMILSAIERILKLADDTRAVYLMRHLVTFLLFYISVIFFYFLCKKRFQQRGIGLLGCLFLVLSPRVFAHSFYNSKDISCLAMFVICFYTLGKYLDRKTPLRAFFHAIACAFLIDIRLMGILLPFLTFVFFSADIFLMKANETNLKKALLSLLTYTFVLLAFVILLWPALWINPLTNFIAFLKIMSRYSLYHSLSRNTVLFLGDYKYAINLPFSYIPVWMTITTPISYSFFFLIGIWISIKRYLEHPIQSYTRNKQDLMFTLWYLLPLISVIILHSVLFDEWRHMLSIYPAYLMLALVGLTSFFRFIKSRFKGSTYWAIYISGIVMIVLNLFNVTRFMVKYHPYQNLYFNILAGKNMPEIKNKFELDYWGLSFRKALEYIVKNDKASNIKIYAAQKPGEYNSLLLLPEDRKRLKYVQNLKQAKYFISNYRWHKEEYPFKNEYYSLKIDGAKIVVVYKFD